MKQTIKSSLLVFPIIGLALLVVGHASSTNVIAAVPRETRAEGQAAAKVRALNALSANGPNCSGSWPTNMALVLLKNAGVTDSGNVDFSKTKTARIASQKIEKDLYHQVYDVTFTTLSGRKIETIVVIDASQEDCSSDDTDVFLVSKHLSSKSEY
jgi:hypothetical protein